MSKLFAAWVILTFCHQSFSADTEREAILSWRPKTGATQYEVQIGKYPDLEPIIVKSMLSPKPEVSVHLKPGSYSFRLRWFKSSGKPSPWSDAFSFFVNPRPPELNSPTDKKTFTEKLTDKDVAFQWQAGIAGTRSKVQIREPGGEILEFWQDENSLIWKPPEAGTYQWRVQYEMSPEWSRSFSFTVVDSAIVKNVIEKRIIETPKTKSKFSQFHVNSLAVFQYSGGHALSGELGWSPLIEFTSEWGVRAYLSASYLNGASSFVFGEGILCLQATPLKFSPFGVEIGSGVQVWGNMGTYPAATVVVDYLRSPLFMKPFDRAFIGYSVGWIPNNLSQFIKLGLGFSF